MESARGSVRVCAAAVEHAGRLVLGPLYTAIGTRLHNQRRREDPAVITEALTECALPASLASAATSTQFDQIIKDSHHEASDDVGLDVGTPVLRIAGTALFGPVVTPAPPPRGRRRAALGRAPRRRRCGRLLRTEADPHPQDVLRLSPRGDHTPWSHLWTAPGAGARPTTIRGGHLDAGRVDRVGRRGHRRGLRRLHPQLPDVHGHQSRPGLSRPPHHQPHDRRPVRRDRRDRPGHPRPGTARRTGHHPRQRLGHAAHRPAHRPRSAPDLDHGPCGGSHRAHPGRRRRRRVCNSAIWKTDVPAVFAAVHRALRPGGGSCSTSAAASPEWNTPTHRTCPPVPRWAP
ncbi:mycothiol-dependent nitroreductase Rv2466c family protein [Streptomyces griseus]|uniref:mycothiol-dependent nitroreductase Rv2466c family protein n=1 Tax=Streptomyces griseus TaxID=1911 RepID=UPI003F687D04